MLKSTFWKVAFEPRNLLTLAVLGLALTLSVASAIPGIGGDEEGLASCTDIAATAACTQWDLKDVESDDLDTELEKLRIACTNETVDNDGADWEPTKGCDEANPNEEIVGICDAEGTLEVSGDVVPLKIYWYSGICSLAPQYASTCLQVLQNGSMEVDNGC